MPDPNDSSRPSWTAEESFFELLGETLGSLDRRVRGQFLSRFFLFFASTQISEEGSAAAWDRILARRRELSESGSRPVSLEAAIVDVLEGMGLLRLPIVVEYQELRKLQLSAGSDALTGLYNRRLFDDHFEKELGRAKRSSSQLALVIMDLHRFKEVNDRHGHPQGDRALCLVASAARETARASDFIFRIGGDEFAILLPRCDEEQCLALSQRLRARYETAVRGLGLDVPLTLDFGIAVHPEDGDKRDALVRVADRRLYEMKNGPANTPPRLPAAPRDETLRDKRRWERVSLAGTSAHILWNQQTVPVIDVSLGGVALSVDNPDSFPEEFPATLVTPIQLPVEVALRKSNAKPSGATGTRLGCVFLNAGSTAASQPASS